MRRLDLVDGHIRTRHHQRPRPRHFHRPSRCPRERRLHTSLEVHNVRFAKEADEARYTDATQPIIYINFRKTALTGTSIDRVQLLVEQKTKLEYCDPRGGGEVEPWTTGVVLPAGLSEGDLPMTPWRTTSKPMMQRDSRLP